MSTISTAIFQYNCQENRVKDEVTQIDNKLCVEEDQTADFDGFEDSDTSTGLDFVEKDEVVYEEKSPNGKKNGSNCPIQDQMMSVQANLS